MSQELVLIGFVLLFVAIILILVGSVLGAEKSGGKVEWSVGGFIGPIPFGWASSPEMLKWTMAITTIVLVAFVLILFLKLS